MIYKVKMGSIKRMRMMRTKTMKEEELKVMLKREEELKVVLKRMGP